MSIRLGYPVEIYGTGKQLRQWLNVKDNEKAIKKLLILEVGETYNIGSDDIIENIKLIKLMINIVNKNFDIWSHLLKISFVKDRPGRDYRYAINFNKLIKNKMEAKFL